MMWPVLMREKESLRRSMNREFLPYISEFRTRFLRCVFVFLFLVCALFSFRKTIYSYLAYPLLPFLSSHHLIATGVLSSFWVPVKAVFFFSFLMGLPFFLIQLWNFVVPALYRAERRLLCLLIVLGCVLFLLGVFFSYFVVFPIAFLFSAQMLPSSVQWMTDIDCYWSFVFSCFLSFGLCFELPVFMLLGSCLWGWGPLQYKAYRRHAIVASFVLAAVLSPPDVLSQCLLAVPLCFLYELGIMLTRLRIFQHVVRFSDETAVDKKEGP